MRNCKRCKQLFAVELVPIPVQRRLILGLCGWRWDGTGYQRAGERISEEQLDALDDKAWQAYIGAVLSVN